MFDTLDEKEFYQWLGKEYQSLRERRGMKQKEVAQIAGIYPTELSRFETTGKKISAYKILRLLKAINSSMEEILGEAEKKNLPLLSMVMS